ncbi:MAG: ImmA/IrrE family metallo-endopeptidase [Oscillospiraceae bacterium]|nr:ImmA/IrrE family metallo-endopeptidase [Oscillospiraceae bacterium]
MNAVKRLQSLYDLAEDHDIGVYYYDIGDGKAAAVTVDDQKLVALNPYRISSIQDETECLCHELGHLETGTLHPPGADEATVLRSEYRAACWVVERLVPCDELLEAIHDYGCTEVWQLSEYFGVSEDLILDAVKIYRNRKII